MSIQSVERLHYYQRQWLGAEDFHDQQAYHRSMRQRHNLAHHTPGIVTGLELVFLSEDPNGGIVDSSTDLWLQPGMAVDGFGREIIVFRPVKINGAAIGSEALPSAANLGNESIVVRIWLAYDESAERRPAKGFENCDPQVEFGRMAESFALVLDFEDQDIETAHTQVLVDGRFINSQKLKDTPPVVQASDSQDEKDAKVQAIADRQKAYDLGVTSDEGVPHQELPSGQDEDNWLIYLGRVAWNGKGFGKASIDKTERVYVSAVASQILAPAGELRIRDRKTDPLHPAPHADPSKEPPLNPGVAVRLEGSLTVERLITALDDIQIRDHRLDFRSQGGSNESSEGEISPTTLERQNLDLRVTTGGLYEAQKRAETLARFVVGSQDNGAFTPHFLVENSGTVSVEGRLEVKQGLNVLGGAVINGITDLRGDLILTGTLDIQEVEGDRLVLWGSTAQNDAAALGVVRESNKTVLYYRTSQAHRWYINTLPGPAQTAQMNLSADGLTVSAGQFEVTQGRFMVSPNGTVGVNTLNPNANALFDVNGSFMVMANGNVGVNRSNPTATLDVNGSLLANSLQATNLQADSLQANNLQASSLQANSLQASSLQANSLQANSLRIGQGSTITRLEGNTVLLDLPNTSTTTHTGTHDITFQQPFTVQEQVKVLTSVQQIGSAPTIDRVISIIVQNVTTIGFRFQVIRIGRPNINQLDNETIKVDWLAWQ